MTSLNHHNNAMIENELIGALVYDIDADPVILETLNLKIKTISGLKTDDTQNIQN